jgi:hypothetical protein
VLESIQAYPHNEDKLPSSREFVPGIELPRGKRGFSPRQSLPGPHRRPDIQESVQFFRRNREAEFDYPVSTTSISSAERSESGNFLE